MSVCKAPHTNIYFTVEGNASPCWLTCGTMGSWSEQNSIRDIWFGERFSSWRNQEWPELCIRNCRGNYTGHCNSGSLLTAYQDNKINDTQYPSMMELELSNRCNYKCIMCDERLSSGIRADKGLPPLPMAYTDKFVDEIEEFIPHLQELRFNGGEPFIQPIVYTIIDRVLEINPTLRINLATNGSIYNEKIENYLNNGNIGVNISIDSLTPEIYKEIRINGNLETVLENFHKFKKKANHVCIQVNPMRMNYHEMANYVPFVDKNNVYLAFNVVRYPRDLSLIFDPDLEKKWEYMKTQCEIMEDKSGQWHVFNHLVNIQMKEWVKERKMGNNGYNKTVNLDTKLLD